MHLQLHYKNLWIYTVSQERSLGSTTITEQTKLNGGNSPYIAVRRLETLNKQMDMGQDYNRIFLKGIFWKIYLSSIDMYVFVQIQNFQE